MGIYSLSQLVDRHGQAGTEVNISLGVRPSGTVHLGNLITLALAQGLARKIGPHQSKINLTICDLDLPEGLDWKTIREGYAKHYRDLPDPTKCHRTLSEHSTAEITDFYDSLAKDVNVPVEIRKLSEIQRDPLFREGIKRVLETPGLVSFLIPHLAPGTVPVYPLCPECKGSYTGSVKGKRNSYENGRISTFCNNDECSVKDFDVDIMDPSIDLSVHMFIDPLRDSLLQPYADIHVFGGDYNEQHGANKLSKIEKILRVMNVASNGERVPDVLIGPTIYARDGKKMSKSCANGLDVKRLRDFLGPEEYAGKILKFTMDLVGEGYNNIDYPQVVEKLLGSGFSQ
jgi:tryptophanyl-tRNA synthetase